MIYNEYMVFKKRLNIRKVLTEVRVKRLTFFTPSMFANIFNTSLSGARIFLSRNTRLGYFIRLRKGIYSPADLQPSSFEIANMICKPSYISLEIALSFYHVIPETVYSITSITTKHSQRIETLNQVFIYHKLNKSLYFGYEVVDMNSKKIIMATKEKSLLDYLYFVARGQKEYNERFDIRNLDKHIISNYSQVFLKNIKNNYIKKRFTALLEKMNL